ncbi:MAG: glycosyltransferase family protein [Candidatus Heimdallarchaeota archaeon]
MKVLYGINTNGQGHINRSRVFVNELMNDGHEVQVLFSGKKPPKYAYEIAPVAFYRLGPIDMYKDHKVDVYKSLQVNLGSMGKLTRNRRDLLEIVNSEEYDVIFTDFEPTSSVVGRILKKPVICIDHQQSIFHPANQEAPAKPLVKSGMKFAIRLMLPYYSHCFSIDFVNEIKVVDNHSLYPLIWKSEFNNLIITYENHYLVYLARYNKDEVIRVLSTFPEEIFHVYGFNTDEKHNNVFFKKTSRDGFLQDLVSCKGVIGNAGFNLAWEACIAKKNIWMIPHSNNFEQLSNAFRLKKHKRAFVTESLTRSEMRYFLTKSKEKDYKPTVEIPILQPSILMKEVYEFLNNYEEPKKKDRKGKN